MQGNEGMRRFLEWAYRAREMYDNLTMFVPQGHSISLNFTQNTVRSGDSLVFGLIMGVSDKSSSVSLLNHIVPDRHSFCFNQDSQNALWGTIKSPKAIPISDRLVACTVNRCDDILVSTPSSLSYYGEGGGVSLDWKSRDIVSLIECSPLKFSNDALLGTTEGRVMYYAGGDSDPIDICKFHREFIDISTNPFDVCSALVSQGKSSVHLIDRRDSQTTKIRMSNHISGLDFAPGLPFIFAAGRVNGGIEIRDMRNLLIPVCTYGGNGSGIASLKWCPHARDLILTAGFDGKINILSARNMGKGLVPIFVHGGHLAPIIAADWCKDIPWTVASVSEDQLLEVWTIGKSKLCDYLDSV
jgi:WD40 repeat protein